MIFFVNNEIIDDADFLNGNIPYRIFIECFGIVKIEVIIGNTAYITQNARVIVKESVTNNNVINMIDYIYNNCDRYLYEEHKSSKISTGITPDKNVSLDTKLSLLDDIYDVYVKSYMALKNSPQTKLINYNKVGDFNELTSVNQYTMLYIVNHPEELQPVNYKSGIKLNKQYYQPRKTLVQSVTYSSDIYENRVVLGFLKTIIQNLKKFRNDVENHRYSNTTYRCNGYIDSAYYIFTKNSKVLDEYINTINYMINRFQNLFAEYKNILNVSDMMVSTQPMYTNIFRKIMPYNIIYKKIVKWFQCGIYDIAKSDLILSFVSTSKIYEYFCLLKIIRSIEDNGYTLLHEYPFEYSFENYKKTFYYNTIYNNTFEYKKDDVSLTLYFQPVIYSKSLPKEKTNNIALFRNTSISIDVHRTRSIDDSEGTVKRGSYYTPDYLIKISYNKITNYYILDAKHSNSFNIKKYQLPSMVFKYLFSIGSLSSDSNVNGLCILCGQSKTNSKENIHDIAEPMNIPISPSAYIYNVTGYDVDNDIINEYITKIEEAVLKN